MRKLIFLGCTVVGCASPSERHPEITRSAVCGSCSIDVQVVWTSTREDENIPGEGWPFEVADTLWMLGEMFGPTILRLPLNGDASIVHHREGDGPGEFRWIVGGQPYAGEDTIVVVQNSRVSYLTRELVEVRSFPNPVPRPKGLLVLEDGTLISTNPQLASPVEARGFALHVVRPTGEYAGSFRPTNPLYNIGIWPMARARQEAAIWVVESRPTGFIAEMWDVEHTDRIDVLRISPDWWVAETKTPEDYEASGSSAEVALPSGAVGVWDSGDIIWIALRHFDAFNSTVDFETAAMHEWFDGVLLAIDKKSAKILATAVFDEFLLGFTNRGRLVLYTEHDGHPQVRLAETVLRGT